MFGAGGDWEEFYNTSSPFRDWFADYYEELRIASQMAAITEERTTGNFANVGIATLPQSAQQIAIENFENNFIERFPFANVHQIFNAWSLSFRAQIKTSIGVGDSKPIDTGMSMDTFTVTTNIIEDTVDYAIEQGAALTGLSVHGIRQHFREQPSSANYS